MRDSRHFVSLRTYALAFAVVLSPALFQTSYSCERGDTYLTQLELEADGINQIVGFNPETRSYDVSTNSPTAILRTVSRDPGSTVTYQWIAGGTSIESGMIGVGGGDVTLNVPVGHPTLSVSVRAPEGGFDRYAVNVASRDAPCTEQGIRDAIAMGGGPYTFDCNGPTTVVTQAEIVIDNDVILDGEGNLTLEVNGEHGLFAVSSGVTAELHGFTMSTGSYDCRCWPVTGCDLCWPFAIYNLGTLT
ncbi:MAG: hypothetical protein JRD94_18300, partial [Deltaproteobacteria bacterium]|nr:hypothetical protein [Deltaproteobacteria bacterium]